MYRFKETAILAGRLAAVRDSAINDMRYGSLLRRLSAQEQAQAREAVAGWQRETWALLSTEAQERAVEEMEKAFGG